jgi:DNA-binding beta-propeller fold protein YncE
MNIFSLSTVRAKIRAGFLAFTFPVILMVSASAQAQNCSAPATDVASTVSLPGAPFSAIPTKDGCTIFVSMNLQQDRTTPGHIAVFGRAAGKVTLAQDLPVPGQGLLGGMALSHDGKLLAVSNGSGVLLLDANQLVAGDSKPIAEAKDQAAVGPQGQAGQAESIYVAISPDDKLLFVSDENTASVTVYDLTKLRGGDTNAIGRISVGNAPVGLVFSPDGRRLYTTSEIAQPGSIPATCPGEGGSGGTTPQGLLTVVDVARAATDPAGSVLAKVPGGCDPVRITLSKDGTRAFVTARGADSLLVFDTAKLVADSDHALIASVIAGKSPVGVAVAGQNVVTADSNRFAQAGRKGEWLSVINPVTYKVIGNVPAGLFPRELYVTQDGKTLLVTNFSSNSLELIDLARLTPAYFAQQKPIKDADDAEQAKAEAALQARIAAKQSSPGTEAALRKFIASLMAKAPIYDDLTPNLANNVRQSADSVEKLIEGWGALQSVTFVSITPQNADVYEVDFEHQKSRWTITIAPDGKIGPLGFGPMQ